MSDSGSSGTPGAASEWRAPESGSGSGSLPPPAGNVLPGSPPVAELPPRRLGWTPPPRRGLVPLRPIPFGVILGAPFRLQRRTPRTTLAPALVLSLVATALAALVSWGLTAGPRAALDAAYYSDYVAAQNLLGVLGAAGGFAPLALALAANALLAGVVVIAASRAVLAERVSFRGVRWRLTGRMPRLIGWTLLVLLAAGATLALATVLPASLALGSAAGGVFAFLVAFLESIGIVLVGGYLAARVGFTSHVIALEGLGLGAAVRRSWRLTHRAGWRLFGSQLLVWVVVAVAAFVLIQPVSWALDLGVGLIFPTGPTQEQVQYYLAARTVIVTAVTAIVGAFGLVLQSVTAALLYLDTRMRTEGLDLALARYVDERQRGTMAADPFPGGGTA